MKIIGNKDILDNLTIVVESAKRRKAPVPHILFAGVAGCGKTTTAKYIATLLKIDMLSISAGNIKEGSDISAFCKMLLFFGRKHRRFPLVFIDEIHHLSVKAQETLGLLMEEFKAPVKIGGMGQDIEISIPPFTLLGATTDDGKLCKPFRDRFKLRFIYKEYSEEDATKIAKYHSELLGIDVPYNQLKKIAIRGRGIPRIIISQLERYRDFAFTLSRTSLTDIQFEGLYKNVLKINNDGLTETDLKIMRALYKQGKAVGLDNLAMIVNESPNVLKNTIEPYLIRKELLTRMPKGRMLTESGVRYLLENNLVEDAELMTFGDLGYA